jgi:hypothetical protein
MKKILVLVSFLVVAAACATSPTNNQNTPANANRTAETKPATAPSEADIIAKEKATWDLVKKKDWDGFGKMLASDYVEVMDNGVHDKAATLTTIKDFDLTDATFADWKMLTIDKDAAILTYTVTLKGTFKGEAAPAGPYRAAAAWVNRNGEWQAIYFQETMVKEPPPQPSPKTTPSPKSASSPKASPSPAGPDVIANEKVVWDALKAGDFDSFASYLASDLRNVQPDGVYDKTQSVQGLSMSDFAKVEVSNWKAVKFDDDASLVTYTVKFPGSAPAEYHSTIWVLRDGKWVAQFHMGTPAGVPPPPTPAKKM